MRAYIERARWAHTRIQTWKARIERAKTHTPEHTCESPDVRAHIESTRVRAHKWEHASKTAVSTQLWVSSIPEVGESPHRGCEVETASPSREPLIWNRPFTLTVKAPVSIHRVCGIIGEWQFTETVQYKLVDILNNIGRLEFPQQTCVMRPIAWHLTLLDSPPPTWSTRLGIGVFGVTNGHAVLLPCWLNPVLKDKDYDLQTQEDWMRIMTLEKKLVSEIPSNASHAGSLLRSTGQSLPDLVPREFSLKQHPFTVDRLAIVSDPGIESQVRY